MAPPLQASPAATAASSVTCAARVCGVLAAAATSGTRGGVQGAPVEHAGHRAGRGAGQQLAALHGAEPVPFEHPDHADPRSGVHQAAQR